MDLLIRYGAVIDGPDGGSAVNGSLHNGRGEAAEFFASRGASLDLEGAAGVGRLDVVRRFTEYKNWPDISTSGPPVQPVLAGRRLSEPPVS